MSQRGLGPRRSRGARSAVAAPTIPGGTLSLRHAINQRPVIAVAAALTVIALAIIILWRGDTAGDLAPPEPIANLDFYSDDDGATYFVDDVKELTPFRHEGKQAVRAYVFRCPDAGLFVGYLQRETAYGQEQKGISLAMGSRPTVSDPAVFEIKKPGDKYPWIPVDPRHFAKVLEVMNVSCPGTHQSARLMHPAER